MGIFMIMYDEVFIIYFVYISYTGFFWQDWMLENLPSIGTSI